MRILFTGGSGKAGRHVIRELAARGHLVLNLDRVPLTQDPNAEVAAKETAGGTTGGVETVTGDVTDLGGVLSIASSHARLSELEDGAPKGFDAIVHFAAIPRIGVTSDAECFRVNTLGTWTMLEAARILGIRKVVLASSETTYGVCFAEGTASPHYLPLDEEHPTVPQDSYAMSKVCNELCGRSFHARTGADIYALRIGNVIEPHEYDRFPQFFADPAVRRRNVFCYIDARDLGQIVDLCLGHDGLGFQVFNAGNDTNSVNLPAAELALRFFPTAELRPLRAPHEALYSNRKIKDMLGFVESHDWRRYVNT